MGTINRKKVKMELVLKPEHTEDSLFEDLPKQTQKLLKQAYNAGTEIEVLDWSGKWIPCCHSEGPSWFHTLKYRVKTPYVYSIDSVTKQKSVGINQTKLRDKFAGIALGALITKFPLQITDEENKNPTYDMLSLSAYEYADAMLKARELHENDV